ncbi:MAG: hypothetical protein QGF59_28850, partial [Pirellulaceae bacterium]|nr:hypothetical protein [Pirellulaceae bacterium]
GERSFTDRCTTIAYRQTNRHQPIRKPSIATYLIEQPLDGPAAPVVTIGTRSERELTSNVTPSDDFVATKEGQIPVS